MVARSTDDGCLCRLSDTAALYLNAGQGELTEDCSGCVVAGKASLTHTGAIELGVSIFFSNASISSSSDDAAFGARVSEG